MGLDLFAKAALAFDDLQKLAVTLRVTPTAGRGRSRSGSHSAGDDRGGVGSSGDGGTPCGQGLPLRQLGQVLELELEMVLLQLLLELLLMELKLLLLA